MTFWPSANALQNLGKAGFSPFNPKATPPCGPRQKGQAQGALTEGRGRGEVGGSPRLFGTVGGGHCAGSRGHEKLTRHRQRRPTSEPAVDRRGGVLLLHRHRFPACPRAGAIDRPLRLSQLLEHRRPRPPRGPAVPRRRCVRRLSRHRPRDCCAGLLAPPRPAGVPRLHRRRRQRRRQRRRRLLRRLHVPGPRPRPRRAGQGRHGGPGQGLQWLPGQARAGGLAPLSAVKLPRRRF